MHKTTRVIVLGGLTAAFAFMGCGAPDDGENSAAAGYSGSTSIAGTRSTTGGSTGTAGSSSSGATTSSGGSRTTSPPTTDTAATSSGCTIGHARSEGALGGLALALALALATRRRRRLSSEPAAR